MKFSDNDKVNDFMTDLQSISSHRVEIIESIRKIFLNANEQIAEDIKYGGLVFNINDEIVGGIFPYSKHISIEFSYGVDLTDKDGYLEGKGKQRRHLKITEKQDIEEKNVAAFVTEAVKNMNQ